MTPTAKLFATMTASELIATRATTRARLDACTDVEQRARLTVMLDELNVALAQAWATAS